MSNAGINFLNWSDPPQLSVNAGTAPDDTAIIFSGACGIRPTGSSGPFIALTGPGKVIWIESPVSLIPTTARYWTGDPVFTIDPSEILKLDPDLDSGLNRRFGPGRTVASTTNQP